jgi:hypothetical protein
MTTYVLVTRFPLSMRALAQARVIYRVEAAGDVSLLKANRGGLSTARKERKALRRLVALAGAPGAA